MSRQVFPCRSSHCLSYGQPPSRSWNICAQVVTLVLSLIFYKVAPQSPPQSLHLLPSLRFYPSMQTAKAQASTVPFREEENITQVAKWIAPLGFLFALALFCSLLGPFITVPSIQGTRPTNTLASPSSSSASRAMWRSCSSCHARWAVRPSAGRSSPCSASSLLAAPRGVECPLVSLGR